MMKSHRWLIPCLMIGFTLASSSPAQAQQSIGTSQQTVQQWRAEVTALLDASSAVYGTVRFKKGQDRVAAARNALANITDVELESAFKKSGVPDMTEANAAIQQWATAMPGILARQAQRKAQGTSLTTSNGGFSISTDPTYGLSNEGLPDKEALYGPCEDIVHDSEAIFITLNVTSVLRIAAAVASRLCELTILGQNTAAACIVTDLLYEGSQYALDLMDFCGGEEDSRTIEATFERVGTVHDKLVAGLNNSQALTLRLAIEQALASNSPMAFLAVPKVYGGRLEEVRQIVTASMANAQAAGMSIGTAQQDVAFGDKLYTAGDYRGAYRRYQQAYHQAGP